MDDWTRTKNALTDPVVACTRLGLLKGSRRIRSGLNVHCPGGHSSGNTPSLSVWLGADGTIQCNCHACEIQGSLIDLVAACYHVPPRSRDALVAAASIAGIELTTPGKPPPPPIKRTTPTVQQETRTYMPDADLHWSRFSRVDQDEACMDYLTSRGLSPLYAAQNDLLRRFRPDPSIRWDWVRNDASEAVRWQESGHLLAARVYDARGTAKGIRGWRVTDYPARKRTPASGYLTAGLVLADEKALRVLRGGRSPVRLVITEGEPDFVTACQRWGYATLGIYSGSWTQEIADRIPAGSTVVIATDPDDAGEKYATSITETFGSRCQIRRLK